jgi:hypothetical protein
MRDRYLRKRVTIHSNLGHHRTVLRLTRRIPSYATATRAVVRLGSLKYVGDLRDSIDLGKTTTTRAARQPHAILAANAAFQTTQAMVWSGQIVEARHYLDEVLRPYAQLASNRWLGWAEFLEGCLLIHEQAPPTNDPVDDQALHALLRAYRRFDAERLNDGRVSATLAALTRLRQIGDDTGYRQQRVLLASLIDDRVDTYYARGHPTTRAAAAIEDADFSWFHESDVAEAEHLYRTAVALGVPLQRAAAQTQLASLEHHLGRPEAAKTADSARAEAERIGAIGLVERAEATARGIAANDLTIGELFFP